MPACILAFLTLSAFQTASALAIIAAFIALAFALGAGHGRTVEAHEPRKKLAQRVTQQGWISVRHV